MIADSVGEIAVDVVLAGSGGSADSVVEGSRSWSYRDEWAHSYIVGDKGAQVRMMVGRT